jgi:plasmid stabilization system protein ParE
MTVAALEQQALRLPPADRVRLAESIMESVEDYTDPEVAKAWEKEIARRIRRLIRGRRRASQPKRCSLKRGRNCMLRVVYHRLAGNEFIRSGLHYEQRRPFIGEAFIDAVEQAVADIQRHPNIGRSEKDEARSIIVRRFPFRVVYQVQSDRIWIIAVAHFEPAPRLLATEGQWVGWREDWVSRSGKAAFAKMHPLKSGRAFPFATGLGRL